MYILILKYKHKLKVKKHTYNKNYSRKNNIQQHNKSFFLKKISFFWLFFYNAFRLFKKAKHKS